MKILIVTLILFSYVVCARFVSVIINKIGSANLADPYHSKRIAKTINLALAVFFLILLFLFLGIEYSQLSLFLSSIFAVLGVALFAQWSMLSNITASLIIFFAFPYRVGDHIKVVDNDDDISGVVEEISLFHVMIRRGDELITYPNILILQKAVIKMPAVKDAVQTGSGNKMD